MTTPAHAQFLARRAFSSLDGVRCFAVTAVVWHHTAPTLAGLAVAGRGFLGVDMFFVLSGFLIVTLLLRERDAHGGISLRDFYVRRTLRIFPLYYAIVLGLAAVAIARPQSSLAASYFDDLPALLTYTSNWAHVSGLLAIAWSLATEEQFYLVWPAVERYLARAWLPVLLGALVVNQAINLGLADGLFPVGARARLEILQVTFTPILLGVGLAHVLHSPAGWARLAPWLGHRAAPWLLTLALLLVCSVPGDVGGVLRLGIHIVMVALLASLVIRDDTLGGLLTFAPVVRIGVVSYGVYLLHMFVRHGAGAALERAPLRLPGDLFVVTLLATWLVAEVSYRVFEVRFLALKKRFARTPPHMP